MSALSIQPPFPIFTETDGLPLEDGYVWIGQVNLDPQVNPINVYWDAALTIPAAQPIRTLGGYPANSGTPARLYVNSDYSIRVMNKNGSMVYSAPAATERYSGLVLTGINAEDVIYDPPFVGGVQTNVEAKLAQTVSVKDFGAVGDGVTDDTAAIQAALNTGKNVFIPNGTYVVDPDTSVSPVSNQRITLEQEAVLQASASSSSGVYSVIRIFGVSDVIVEGGTVIGDRATHIGVLGESGMGIYVADSSGITIRDVETRDCWGDGIYVGGTGTTGKSTNVRIENVRSDNNRRQGLTIAAAYSVVVDGGSFTNTNGTAPAAGIDIEPNPGKGEVENVVVQNARCSGNNGHGIAVSQTICKNVKLVNNTCVLNGLSGIQSAYIGSDLLVSGNTVTDNTEHGVNIQGDNAYVTREIIIDNNTVKNNGLTGIRFYNNIIRFNVRGNIVYGNGHHGMSFEGVTSVCDDGIITDNFCESNSQVTSLSYDNILVGALAHFLRLSHNTCRKGTLTNEPAYGIRLTNNEAHWVTDNDLYTGGQTANYSGVFANVTLQRNIGFKTENRVLSNTFAVDAIATPTITIAHGCAYTPSTHHCQLTIVDPSALGFAEGAVKIQSVDATNVTARVNITTAAGAGTTARLALAVDRPSVL
jgi:parallel beta-helix repeat protein